MKLINNSDMSKGSLRRRGESLYHKFVESHLEEVKINIKRCEKEYGDEDTYKIKEEDLREMLDENIKNNDYRVIQRGLQLHLWKYGIVVFTTLRSSGKRNFRFRKKTEYDKPHPGELSSIQ